MEKKEYVPAKIEVLEFNMMIGICGSYLSIGGNDPDGEGWGDLF